LDYPRPKKKKKKSHQLERSAAYPPSNGAHSEKWLVDFIAQIFTEGNPGGRWPEKKKKEEKTWRLIQWQV